MQTCSMYVHVLACTYKLLVSVSSVSLVVSTDFSGNGQQAE
jgi:hypothetical protein